MSTRLSTLVICAALMVLPMAEKATDQPGYGPMVEPNGETHYGPMVEPSGEPT